MVAITQKDHGEKQWKITRKREEPAPGPKRPGCGVWTSSSKRSPKIRVCPISK